MALRPASTDAGRSPVRLEAQRREVALPNGECEPKSVWVKAERRYPLIPRETRRFRDLYARCASIEHEFVALCAVIALFVLADLSEDVRGDPYLMRRSPRTS